MKISPEIRIFVVCHKPAYVLKNPLLFPIQVGAALNAEHYPCMLYDDTGDNISRKNPMYCELTAQYWAWKNVDCDYYGFFHYRRYLSFADIYPVDSKGKLTVGKNPSPYLELDTVWGNLEPYRLESQWMESVVKSYDLLTVLRERINTTVYRQYCQYHSEVDLKLILEIVKKTYPEYTRAAEQYMASKEIYYMNMYIMTKRLFHDYMEWLFTILREFEQQVADCGRQLPPRQMGFLAERLFGIFYYYQREHGAQCAELAYLKFYNTEPGKEECVSNIRTFRFKPTKFEIRIDMRKLNRAFPAGSRRRRIIRSIFLR